MTSEAQFAQFTQVFPCGLANVVATLRELEGIGRRAVSGTAARKGGTQGASIERGGSGTKGSVGTMTGSTEDKGSRRRGGKQGRRQGQGVGGSTRVGQQEGAKVDDRASAGT